MVLQGGVSNSNYVNTGVSSAAPINGYVQTGPVPNSSGYVNTGVGGGSLGGGVGGSGLSIPQLTSLIPQNASGVSPGLVLSHILTAAAGAPQTSINPVFNLGASEAGPAPASTTFNVSTPRSPATVNLPSPLGFTPPTLPDFAAPQPAAFAPLGGYTPPGMIAPSGSPFNMPTPSAFSGPSPGGIGPLGQPNAMPMQPLPGTPGGIEQRIPPALYGNLLDALQRPRFEGGRGGPLPTFMPPGSSQPMPGMPGGRGLPQAPGMPGGQGFQQMPADMRQMEIASGGPSPGKPAFENIPKIRPPMPGKYQSLSPKVDLGAPVAPGAIKAADLPIKAQAVISQLDTQIAGVISREVEQDPKVIAATADVDKAITKFRGLEDLEQEHLTNLKETMALGGQAAAGESAVNAAKRQAWDGLGQPDGSLSKAQWYIQNEPFTAIPPTRVERLKAQLGQGVYNAQRSAYATQRNKYIETYAASIKQHLEANKDAGTGVQESFDKTMNRLRQERGDNVKYARQALNAAVLDFRKDQAADTKRYLDSAKTKIQGLGIQDRMLDHAIHEQLGERELDLRNQVAQDRAQHAYNEDLVSAEQLQLNGDNAGSQRMRAESYDRFTKFMTNPDAEQYRRVGTGLREAQTQFYQGAAQEPVVKPTKAAPAPMSAIDAANMLKGLPKDQANKLLHQFMDKGLVK